MGERGEVEAAIFEDRVAGVWLDGGPDGVWAVVYYGEKERWLSCCRECYEEGDEDEERMVQSHIFVCEETLGVCEEISLISEVVMLCVNVILRRYIL